MQQEKKPRGFAALSPEKRREIAQKGGKAISQNKDHMSKIGKVGGNKSGQIRSNKTDNENPY